MLETTSPSIIVIPLKILLNKYKAQIANIIAVQGRRV